VLPCKQIGDKLGVSALSNLFLAGKFQKLYDLALEREKGIREEMGKGEVTPRRSAHAAARLIKMGEYSRAMKRCSSHDGQREADDDVIDQLKALHSTAGAISAEQLAALRQRATDMINSKVADDHFELRSDSLAAAIRLAPRGSAGSGTGWIFEHYKALIAGSKEQLEELLHCVQRLIAGKLDPVITEALGSCTLIALAKPDGTIRPIAIGEVLRRLAGKAICYQLKEDMCKFFFPSQYGVQTRGGCEQIVHTIRAHHHLHRNDVLLRIDCVNAFNRVSRHAFLQAILDNKQFSNIFPFVAQFYLPHSPLHVVDKDGSVSNTIPSTSGTQQGDPLGPFLFALAIHKSIEEVLAMRSKNADEDKDDDEAEKGEAPESDDADARYPLSSRLTILGYLDDIHIVGPAKDVAAAFELLKAKLGAVDLELSGPSPPKRPTGKNNVWARKEEDVDCFMNHLSADSVPLITRCPSGFVVLGVPYGPSAATAMREQLDNIPKANALATKLGGLDVMVEAKLNHEAWLLLLYCVAPSIGYVQRCAPPHLTLSMASAADEMIRRHAELICSLPQGCFSEERVREQFHLRKRGGGTALRCAVAANSFAYTASLADFGPECCKRWPHIRPVMEELGKSPDSEPSALNPEEIHLTPEETAERPDWMLDVDRQRSYIRALPGTEHVLSDNSFTTSAGAGGKREDRVKHQKLFSTADNVFRRKRLDTIVDADARDAKAAGASDVAVMRYLAWWNDTLADGRCGWTRVPTANARYRLSPSDLEFSMRRLLRLPIRGLNAGALCGCGDAIDCYGDHADCCRLLQGQRGKRHDRVNMTSVLATARQACLPAEPEKSHLNEDNNGRPADTYIPYGLEAVFGNRSVCYDVVGVGSAVEQYLAQACQGVGGAMNFGVKRKLRSTRRLDDDKVVVPMPFTSQGALHANFRTSYEMWAAHWATCGEGRDAKAQGELVRLWLSQASAVVQMAQNRLTRKLVEMLLSVNPGSGDMMKALRPFQLHELEGQCVLGVPS